MIAAVRTLVGLVPVQFGIGGRAESLAAKTFDPLFSRRPASCIRTPLGPLQLDMSHGPERFLACCYHNLKRHYRSSGLGQYIRQRQPGRTFVDVGANLGFYSLLAREAGLNTAAFEPEPSFARFLQRNERIFGRVFPVALGDKDESLPLYILPGNSGAASLVPQEGCVLLDERVPVRTFSEFALGGQLGDPAQIDLVKIDVEGAEESTVRGMGDFLEAGYRPDIWCELRGNRARRSAGSYALARQILKPFGYTMLDAPDTGEPQPCPSEEVLGSRSVFDALFRVEH